MESSVGGLWPEILSAQPRLSGFAVEDPSADPDCTPGLFNGAFGRFHLSLATDS
jgi:hypothetical protein